MTVLRDISMLWSLFHILILFMLLYRSRYPRKKTLILTGMTMGPLALLTVAGLAYYGAEFMGQIFILTLTLPSLLFFWFMSKDKKGKFFFTFCVADTVALWIIAVTNLADFYLGGQRYILLLLLLMPMTYATIFAAMYRQLLLHRKRQSERILQAQKSTLEAQLDSQQSIRKMKHDIKGYTATLSGLLSAGKIKEAEEYLAGVEQKTDISYWM